MPSTFRAFGRLRAPIAAVVIVALSAITMAAAQVPSTSSHLAAQCVRRTATAKPPPRLPPRPTTPKRKTARVRKVGGLTSCPSGQVPRIVSAKRNVPKGNPLIGPVRGSAKLFFGSPKRQRKLILKALLPFRKVYKRGGGGQPHQSRLVPRSALGPGCNGVMSFGSCYYYGSAAYRRTARGGGTTMTVAKPAYDGSGGPGHSLDEIAVQGGTSDGNIVELGWNVSTAQYANSNPHLFVFHWIGWTPTCYDTCAWHQYNSTYAPGGDLGALVGHEVYVGWVYYQGNWWAWFDNQWLGYFPGPEWPAGYTSNSLIQWFGEVSSANGIPPHTDMGTGTFPPATTAARNATLCDVDPSLWVCFYYDQQATAATFPTYYKSAHTGFGEVRYGGPGE
jgi:Neprosin